MIPGGGSFKRADGGRTITALDVFAVTATPSPMNNGTRVLATKALDDYDQIRTKARDDMLALLTAEPEPVATKSVRPPVEIATVDC